MLFSRPILIKRSGGSRAAADKIRDVRKGEEKSAADEKLSTPKARFGRLKKKFRPRTPSPPRYKSTRVAQGAKSIKPRKLFDESSGEESGSANDGEGKSPGKPRAETVGHREREPGQTPPTPISRTGPSGLGTQATPATGTKKKAGEPGDLARTGVTFRDILLNRLIGPFRNNP
ncbi:uncharacterized protein LOC100900170 [Galendromus occidentalis]|uniref:Uncharacterized protein LOC100900170 n=1 Tax=Galendromus occidentalis TaxID=34638 RepID=A0AAJ7L647_9ACAR|nr:uncharacterized protein LOC100900170 [Galendromus occidentalis]